MTKFNDLDMRNWREYVNIFTDSLWLIKRRDNSGAHNLKYHGNFVPQIPNQLFSRYTKKGDWIMDPFMGSGTSLIEAQRLGRNSIGIELQKKVFDATSSRVRTESVPGVKSITLNANSKNIDLSDVLIEHNINNVQFIIFHPPYWDIIKFSDDPDDLSNIDLLDDFKSSFIGIIDNLVKYLENGRYCALVIGDKYSDGQITPLGFICMNLFLKKGFILKAIIVKNIGDTDGKSKQQGLWRYRAMSSDYYIFKHEYIMVFKKTEKR